MTSSIKITGIGSDHRSESESAAITALLRTLVYSLALMLMTMTASQAEGQMLIVERGTPFPLMLEMPFATFLVEHPDVIDVHSRGDRSVIVEGLALGVSNIVFINERSIAVANIRIEVCDIITTRTSLADAPQCDHH